MKLTRRQYQLKGVQTATIYTSTRRQRVREQQFPETNRSIRNPKKQRCAINAENVYWSQRVNSGGYNGHLNHDNSPPRDTQASHDIFEYHRRQIYVRNPVDRGMESHLVLQRMAAAISDAYGDSALLLEYGPFFTILFKLHSPSCVQLYIPGLTELHLQRQQ